MIQGQILKNFKLFDGLNDSELSKIAKISHLRNRKRGDLCFVKGDKATEVNLYLSGQVDILIQPYEPSGTEFKVHTVMAGEVFGWSAILGSGTYSTFARCAENVEEVYIIGAELVPIIEQNLHMGYLVMRNLSTIINTRLSQDRERLCKVLSPDFRL